jgi:murein L,D-transpeptidase YcbB/YkuD
MPPRKTTRQLHEEVAAARLRQVAVALERLRWLPRVLPADRVWVDTADARLELFRDNRLVFATRVVIGEDNWQTPEVIANSTSILFNPPWLVPRSIAVKEILPRLAWDPDYLARHHMTWRAGGTFRQEPGPHSALGRLKFEMPNQFDVFLHDTPMKELFASVDRRRSHGCVRIENPRMLAAMLLQKGPEAIDRAIAVGYTHRQSLPTPVPIFLVYQTVVVEPDGSVQFRPDFYGRDEKIWQRLIRPAHRPVAHGGASQRNG